MIGTTHANFEALIAAADRNYRAGDWKQASTDCRKALHIRPGTNQVLFLLAKSMANLGARDLAAEILASIVYTAGTGLRPLHFYALFRYSLIRIRQGKFRTAVEFHAFLVRKGLKLLRFRLLARRVG
jgi:hypothetical protein